jgi:3',5'-cyclic AMP phosphodiesterase CpdA
MRFLVACGSVPGVAAKRVILVSDSHLSRRAPHAQANWEAVLRYVDAASPEAVIHLGDLSLDGAHEPDDLHVGRGQLDRLPVAWHAVPGNHDIGDNPRPGAPAGSQVAAGRLQRWLDVVGPDHWSLAIGGWVLLGINAQLAGSGLDAEERQWSWLERQVSGRDENRGLALLTHKPVAAADAEMASAPPYRFLPAAGRDRLADLFGGEPPALIISGHVHQHRVLRLGGTDHLWVPTTWAVLPDRAQETLGAKRCGVVTLELSPGARPRHEFVAPDGISQLTLADDLPDPYQAPGAPGSQPAR